jgi:hypothetical protein
MKIRILITIALVAFVPFARPSLHDDNVAESEKPVAVAGGETFSVPLPYDQAFQSIVTALQKGGDTIDSASKDAGQIFTAIDVSGAWRQTGTRKAVTVIRDTDTSTLVRVAVTEQTRFKALQTDPWGVPSISASKTSKAASDLRAALHPQSPK